MNLGRSFPLAAQVPKLLFNRAMANAPEIASCASKLIFRYQTRQAASACRCCNSPLNVSGTDSWSAVEVAMGDWRLNAPTVEFCFPGALG
jgi:hypothetical protein